MPLPEGGGRPCVRKAPVSDRGSHSADTWKATPLIWATVVLLIVLDVILYGLSKTFTDIARHQLWMGEGPR